MKNHRVHFMRIYLNKNYSNPTNKAGTFDILFFFWLSFKAIYFSPHWPNFFFLRKSNKMKFSLYWLIFRLKKNALEYYCCWHAYIVIIISCFYCHDDLLQEWSFRTNINCCLINKRNVINWIFFLNCILNHLKKKWLFCILLHKITCNFIKFVY